MILEEHVKFIWWSSIESKASPAEVEIVCGEKGDVLESCVAQKGECLCGFHVLVQLVVWCGGVVVWCGVVVW